MKCDFDDTPSPAVLKKTKQTLTLKRVRGGAIVGSSKPGPRGNRGTPNQESWVLDFIQAAKDIKNIDPCTFQTATNYAKAPCSGYTFYRDYLMTARAGKLIDYKGGSAFGGQISRIFRNPSEGIYRVTTPTANVRRTSAVNLAVNNFTVLTPNEIIWDNNAFWHPSVNPDRLTFKARGLYIVGLQVFFAVSYTGRREIRIMRDGNAIVTQQTSSVASGGGLRMTSTGIGYFDSGNAVRAFATANASGQTGLLESFWVCAITPEGII